MPLLCIFTDKFECDPPPLCLSSRCDEGYGGTHCVPLSPLPSLLQEDFNENLQATRWPEVYGAERGTLSGEPLKSGTALIFKGVCVLNRHPTE